MTKSQAPSGWQIPVLNGSIFTKNPEKKRSPAETEERLEDEIQSGMPGEFTFRNELQAPELRRSRFP